MKLQQLEYVLEIVNNGNRVSAAAEAMHTSQPGVSRQLQLLEAELGVQIFERTRNRIIGLTDPGQRVVELCRRVIADVQALSSLQQDLDASDVGTLTIATTHAQAKYVLPRVIKEFVGDYPDVQVSLQQGDQISICELVDAGLADVAIGTEGPQKFPSLARLPCFDLPRIVVAPRGHPIVDAERLTLEEIAKYPIISYGDRFSGHWRTQEAFERAGLEFKVVLSAIDADVSKTYVRLGLGIAVLTAITVSETEDPDLVALDASALFKSSTVYAKTRPNRYLRSYLVEFIRRIAPQYSESTVRTRLNAPDAW